MALVPNTTLGNLSVQEIRHAMQGLRGSQAKYQAERLAQAHGCSVSRIYELTADLRPRRKQRSDKGKRLAQLMCHPGLKYAASMIVAYNLDPADALRTAELRGLEIPVSLPTFERYLREHGLGSKARRRNIVPYRRWEASAPGELFQFDISGTKERWYDTKKRKIITISELEVSKNHPNSKPERVKIWRFSLLDDHSRYSFVRFYACDKPSSSHVVTFLLDAYSVLGVPLALYADNDATIKFGRNQRATEILGRILANDGGYEVTHHLPGNSKASGKVENSHKRIERNEKLIGLFLAEGRELTLEILNKFGEELCLEYNHREHSTTGAPPIERWHSQRVMLRKLPTDVLKKAFLADEFTVFIRADVTIAHKGVAYQLPTSDKYPFRDWINQQVRIVFPDEAEFFLLLGLDGNEYEIQRVVAKPDVAGDFGRVADSIGQRNRKELKAYAKEQAKAAKELNQSSASPLPIPLIDTKFDAARQTAFFPQPERAVSVAEIADAVPGVVPPSSFDRQLGYVSAVSLLQEGEILSNPLNEADRQWIKSLFGNRETIGCEELSKACEARSLDDSLPAAAMLKRA
jgi:hypothetical protein